MSDLPAYTIEVARLFEAPASADGMEARYRAEFKAVERAYGKEGLAERLGSDRFEEVDLARLDALFTETKDEYEQPQTEARVRQFQGIAEQMQALDLDKLSRVAELVERPRTRRGFRAV
ncbi:hypothetical protein [uncultured Parolsenella sp.]|uniref:hypothetical protein n=1 Tax=uncultured Parolsenella sp. TaxID=2083008 RepID=UPI0027D9ADAE|nr:hypothetical protein [uncultured Parolsenella sp.]